MRVAGNTNCQPHSVGAAGYLRSSANGSTTRPSPRVRSRSCWPFTVTRCAASRSFTPAGSIVTRSFCPLPRRTVTWLRSKSRSLTRSSRHSSRRTPVPYSIATMSHIVPSTCFQELAEFFSTEHDRQLVRHPCSRHMLDRSDVEAEYLFVQKQHRAQRLILRRRADLFVDGEPREKRDKLGCAHCRRVLFLMKENVSPNPVDVRLLGPAAVVPQAHSGAHAVEELRRRPAFRKRRARHREEGISPTTAASSAATPGRSAVTGVH